MISPEIIEAIGLSAALLGVVLGIVSFGTVFFMYKVFKGEKKEMIKIGTFPLLWGAFIALNIRTSSSPDYNPIFLVYSLTHIISIILGVFIILMFFIMLPGLLRVFHKKLIATAGIFAIISVMQRIIFPIFGNPYLSLIQRITIIIPSLFGFFILVKSVEEKEDER